MIKSWKLFLLGILFSLLFAALGYWQVMRAQEKEHLLKVFAERTQATPLTAATLDKSADLRFYRATLTGTFDNQHTLLLDNKIMHGQVGYEVYTPFHAQGLPLTILVDRGFVPLGKERSSLPNIDLVVGNIQLTGMLNLPPVYHRLNKMYEDKVPSWPLRIEYLNLKELADILHYPVYRYILTLAPNHPAGYQLEWQIVTMNPGRHRGYAIQWFALSITLLILSVALNKRSTKK